MILSQIYNKIKATSRIAGSDKAIFYLIPELIPGTPRFDMGDAVLYIVWNLRNVGYYVEYTYPNALFISWRAHDEVYRASESPWSKVLNATRELVLRGETKETVISSAETSAGLSLPSEVVKRKSVLKKTVEFRPTGEPKTSSPAVLSAMYSSAPPPPPASRLPGQLSERHVSFV